MTPTTHPRPEPRYSHRYCQAMISTHLASDIDQTACWMLACIAMAEEDSGLPGPIKIADAVLANQIGLSVAAFDCCRQQAIAAGWLKFSPGPRGEAGESRTLIPAATDAVRGAVV
jgi:hypothetical protein